VTGVLHALYFIAIGLFVAAELTALVRTKRGDTFSEWFWKRFRRGSPSWWASLVLALLFLAWLIPHFWFGWWSL